MNDKSLHLQLPLSSRIFPDGVTVLNRAHRRAREGKSIIERISRVQLIDCEVNVRGSLIPLFSLFSFPFGFQLRRQRREFEKYLGTIVSCGSDERAATDTPRIISLAPRRPFATGRAKMKGRVRTSEGNSDEKNANEMCERRL